MAIFSKASGTPGSENINEVRAVVQAPDRGVAGKVMNEFAPSETGFNVYAAVLDDRYKVGGSTTWERPAASGE